LEFEKDRAKGVVEGYKHLKQDCNKLRQLINNERRVFTDTFMCGLGGTPFGRSNDIFEQSFLYWKKTGEHQI